MVLWQLAGIRAEQAQLRHQYLGQLATLSGEPEAVLAEKWKKQHADLQMQIYLETLKETGIDNLPDPPADFEPPKR
jgi:hypothetical protein